MAKVVFRAFVDGRGFEMWVSDGTFSGTQSLRETWPGSSSGVGSFDPVDLVKLGDEVLFPAGNPDSGGELWKTDGTFFGTELVADINPGGSSSPRGLVTFNDLLFFDASDGTTGYEPWVSDGTASGTMRLADINPSTTLASNAFSEGFSNDEQYLLSNDTHLFFDAFGGMVREIWKTDGTPGGTSKVGDGGLQDAALAGDKIFFSDHSNATGSEFSIIDINTGVKETIDLLPGTNGSNAQQFQNINGHVIFNARGPDTVLTNNIELWTTDGTVAGTSLLMEINPGSNGSFARLNEGIELDGQFLFSADNGNNNFELWVTDGTTAGTQLLKDIAPGSLNGNTPASSFPGNFVRVGDEVYFQALAIDPTGNFLINSLWKTDGTSDGTVQISTGNFLRFTEGNYAVVGDRFFAVTSLDEIFVTDGTESGSAFLNPTPNFDNPEQLTPYGDGVIFQARIFSTIGEELFYSDGTDDGTYLVRNIRFGQNGSHPSDFVVIGDERFTGFDDSAQLDDIGEMVDALAGNDIVMGGLGDDMIHGNSGTDLLNGGGGMDTIRGGTWDDTIGGDGEADQLFGDDGNDWLWGNSGDDMLYGGFDDDTLTGGTGMDMLFGGSGSDWLRGGDDNDMVNGGSDMDTIGGDGGDDILDGDGDYDWLWGGTGSDLFRMEQNDGHDFIMDFEDGVDKIDLSPSADMDDGPTPWGYSSTSDFTIIDDGNGNAFVSLGGGAWVTVVNITAAQLTDSDFNFFGN